MRKLALLAASFAAAVVLCCYVLSGNAPLWLGGLCALLALPALFLRDNKRIRVLLITLGAAAGFLWFAFWTAIFVTPAMELADTTATLDATVLDYPVPTESGVSIDLRLEDGTTLRLYLRGNCEASPGDTLSFTAKCKRADILSGEENSYYTSRGVFLVAYAEEGDVECVPAQRTPLRLSAPCLGRPSENRHLCRVL